MFGQGKQSTFAETLIFSLSLIKGDTTFRPPDYEFRFVPAINLNRSDVEEVRVLRVDPREGTTRNDSHVAVQELFVDMHLRNVSDRYDFDCDPRRHPAVHRGFPRLPVPGPAARRAPLRHARQQPVAVQPRVVPAHREGHQLAA